MTSVIGYFLIIVGVGVVTKGFTGFHPYNQIIYKDEADQAFWGAFGPYLFILGGALLLAGIALIRW